MKNYSYKQILNETLQVVKNKKDIIKPTGCTC